MSAAIASDLERYMLDLLNEERTSRGLDALVLDMVLNASADAHSTWMLEQNVFSHTGIGNSTPTQRMKSEGFDLSGTWRTAENIAAQSIRGEKGYFDDVYDLHIALMNSPGHRANILLPELEVVGIGIQTGEFTYDTGTFHSVMATQNFAMTGGQATPDLAAQPPAQQGASNTVYNMANTLVGDASVEHLVGTPENDVIRGLEGNDTITGRAGNDLIDGGLGIDTAVYTGDQGSYILQISRDDVAIIDRRQAEDGTDTLVNVENIRFADTQFDLSKFEGATNLSNEDFAALSELYVAYFDRAPDAEGLLFWASKLANGIQLSQIAQSFFSQPETQKAYADYLDADGNLQDTDGFVSTVYKNVLGRDADEDGKSFWVHQLDKPDADLTPSVFILAFLNGARASSDANTDARYLEAKTDIGVYFSAIKGMSDYTDAVTVMSLFDGSVESINRAVTEIDRLHTEALDANSEEFLIELTGVIDSPFEIS